MNSPTFSASRQLGIQIVSFLSAKYFFSQLSHCRAKYILNLSIQFPTKVGFSNNVSGSHLKSLTFYTHIIPHFTISVNHFITLYNSETHFLFFFTPTFCIKQIKHLPLILSNLTLRSLYNPFWKFRVADGSTPPLPSHHATPPPRHQTHAIKKE